MQSLAQSRPWRTSGGKSEAPSHISAAPFLEEDDLLSRAVGPRAGGDRDADFAALVLSQFSRMLEFPSACPSQGAGERLTQQMTRHASLHLSLVLFSFFVS